MSWVRVLAPLHFEYSPENKVYSFLWSWVYFNCFSVHSRGQWTDLQSTVIWLGILMGMLCLAGSSQDFCQKIAGNPWFPYQDIMSHLWFPCQDRWDTGKAGQLRNIQILSHESVASTRRALFEIRTNPDKPSSRDGGPPFQDLTSGSKRARVR